VRGEDGKIYAAPHLIYHYVAAHGYRPPPGVHRSCLRVRETEATFESTVNMGLPVKFRNVHYYRIAGKYIFAGDLFITRGALYFFPEIDLDQQRNDVAAHLPHDIAILAVAGVYLVQRLGGSYASRVEFWNETVGNEEFQTKAMEYIHKLKTQRASAAFSETLPVPTRVIVSDISNMRLSWSGTLSFSAQSDTHDFNIGLRRKKSLRNALWEAGLGQV